MAFERNYPTTYAPEREKPKEIHDIIVQKEKEGWEVTRPMHRVERNDFEGKGTRQKWRVVMRRVESASEGSN